MVYFLHQAFFARYSWEARWQGKALNSPCADSREAMNKQCRSFTLFLELLQDLLAHLAPFAYLEGVMCYQSVSADRISLDPVPRKDWSVK